MQPLPRKISMLPPISIVKELASKSRREQTKSIAAANLPPEQESYGTITNGHLPVKLPNIFPNRRLSLQVGLCVT